MGKTKFDNRSGAKRIADERQRQTDKERWSADHDDDHTDRSLAMAAVSYAMPGEIRLHGPIGGLHGPIGGGDVFSDPWPESWDPEWDKRPRHENGTLKKMHELTVETQVRMLEKAGALIAAEIDRLLRTVGP